MSEPLPKPSSQVCMGRQHMAKDLPPSFRETRLEETIEWRMQRLETTKDPRILNKLRDDLYELGSLRQKRLRFMSFGPRPLFHDDHVKVMDRLFELLPPVFEQVVDPPLDPTALPGGYCMKYMTKETLFGLNPSNYLSLCAKWDRVDQLDKVDLLDWLKSNCCSDWSKMDADGDSFGGYWNEPEDSEEYTNAWEWSRRDNLQALIQLDYPSQAIKWTVKFGCRTRQECVAFTVLCCEWLQRKREQMKDVPKEEMEPFGESEGENDGYPISMYAEMLSNTFAKYGVPRIPTVDSTWVLVDWKNEKEEEEEELVEEADETPTSMNTVD